MAFFRVSSGGTDFIPFAFPWGSYGSTYVQGCSYLNENNEPTYVSLNDAEHTLYIGDVATITMHSYPYRGTCNIKALKSLTLNYKAANSSTVQSMYMAQNQDDRWTLDAAYNPPYAFWFIVD